MPNPDKWATFITRVFKGGGSIRLTVPVDTTELLGIKEGDYIEVMITKRKKQDSASLTGGFE